MFEKLHGKFLLHPQETCHKVWDVISTVALVIACIVTPWQLAFYTHLPDHHIPKFIVILNSVVDILFLIDIIVFFNSSYYDTKSSKYVTSRKQIAKNYLCGWFVLDLIAVFPFDKVISLIQS